jgi:hypothetical protein
MSGVELTHSRPRLAQWWPGVLQYWTALWPMVGISFGLVATVSWCGFLVWLVVIIWSGNFASL